MIIRGIRSDNKSGYTGVSWNKAKRKYIAFIKQYGKKMYLGQFDCPKEASKVYQVELKKGL